MSPEPPGEPPAAEPAAATSEPPAATPSPFASALSVLTTLGPPLTIATALMAYFGWARSAQQADSMGVDVSLFGYSTQDYVLRSLKTLYTPLIVAAALGLAWLAVHRALLERLRRPRDRRRLALVGRGALVGGTALGAAGAAVGLTVPAWLPPVPPFVFTAGTASAAYGAWLARAAVAARSRQARDRAPTAHWTGALRSLLVGALITLGLFWALSVFAGIVGRGYADRLARTASQLPRVTVISQNPLGIEAPGVVEQQLTATSKRYRTSGLRLLVRSGGRMFLLTDGWTPRAGRVVVLPDDGSFTWELSHG